MTPKAKKATKCSVKERMIDAAKTLLQQKGYDELTIRNICEKADCSTATFYQYFDSKDELLVSFVVEDKEAMDFSSYSPPQALIEIYCYEMSHICSLGHDVLKHFLTPRNTLLSEKYIVNTQRGSWIMDNVHNQLYLASIGGMLIREHDIFEIDRELRIIYFGYLFHWTLSEGAYDMLPSLRKMLVSHLNIYLVKEFQLSHDK